MAGEKNPLAAGTAEGADETTAHANHSMLAHAQRYAEHGLRVLPLHAIRDGRCTCGKTDCRSAGKHPRTQHGVKDASSDAATIRDWWTRWPDANIGVALDDLVVVDVDPRNGGEVPDGLPATVTARTGSGGWHFIYRAAPGKQYAGRLCQGVDLKSGGRAYIVVAPSVHASGQTYRWQTAPWETDPAPAPDWLPEATNAQAVQLSIVTCEEIPEKFWLDLQRHSKLRQRWNGDAAGLKDTSGSGKDMSVAVLLAKLNYTDGEIAAVLRSFSHGKVEKSDKYLAHTIGKARQLTDDSGFEKLRQALVEGETDSRASALCKPSKDLCLLSAAEILHRAGPIRWLVKNYFERDALVQIFGPPASYKSFLAIDIAVSVASGRDWHGYSVKQGPVIYLAGEGHNGVARRLQAVCQERDIDPETLPLNFSDAAIGLIDPENVSRLRQAIEALETPPQLIVVDTLARNFGPGDENSTVDMNRFVAAIDALRGEATVIVIHHSGHTNVERERGSSALRGALDANYRVDYKPHPVPVVQLTALKMKDARLPDPLFLEPRTVNLPFEDEVGQPATSVVLKIGETMQAERLQAMRELYPALWRGNRGEYLDSLLVAIHDEPGIKQSALEKKLGIAKSSLSKMLGTLRDKKLLDDTENRLTEAGVELAALLVGRQRPDIALRHFVGGTQAEQNG